MKPNGLFFNQPKPFYLVFILEFWERFGFYGVQSILPVYFVSKLHTTEIQAEYLFTTYFALAYSLAAFGGRIGDSIIGTKRTMLAGAITLAISYFILGLSFYYKDLIFFGLGGIATGNGLFKANPSTLLSRCYKTDDHRIESSFTMFYMAINLGSMLSMILIPIITLCFNFSAGFYICTGGLVICIFAYALFRKEVKYISSDLEKKPLTKTKWLFFIIGIIASSYICQWLIQNIFALEIILLSVCIIVFSLYIIEANKLTGIAKKKIWVTLALFIQGFIFFVIYCQMPTSINFFAIHNVQHNIFGIKITPILFQALNPIFIIILSPLIAAGYNYLNLNKKVISIPARFAVGMFISSLSFFVLSLSAQTANSSGIIASNWLVVSYLLQATGELLISGLALSAIAQLVPAKLNGFVVGTWFLLIALASVIAGFISSSSAFGKKILPPMESLPIYANLFLKIGVITAIISIIMILISPYLAKIISQKS